METRLAMAVGHQHAVWLYYWHYSHIWKTVFMTGIPCPCDHKNSCVDSTVVSSVYWVGLSSVVCAVVSSVDWVVVSSVDWVVVRRVDWVW